MSTMMPDPEDCARLSAESRRIFKEACEEAEEIGRQLNEASRKRAEAQIAGLREHYSPKTTFWERIKDMFR